MDAEIAQHRKHTWKLVSVPDGEKPMKLKWGFMNRTNDRGNVSRKRAQLGAKGFTQGYGIDFEEVFSPVAKYTTFGFMFAFSAQQGL